MRIDRYGFNKKKADDRKDFLSNYETGIYMNHDEQEITITDFIKNDLFSSSDNEPGAVLERAAYHQSTIIGFCRSK
ncbi:19771_t:CDS:2 [Funneliformis geosporum]|nr:19771_t:CDS:2 [Funneliformis geosporum]